jgi:hypothetical protein
MSVAGLAVGIAHSILYPSFVSGKERGFSEDVITELLWEAGNALVNRRQYNATMISPFAYLIVGE